MTQLVKALKRNGLSPDLANNLNDFIFLFLKWNEKINLSAARNEVEVREHVMDSLYVIPHLPPGPARVIDVGSGGGFPAVVMAICVPTIDVTALEPVHKKHAFLRTVARELKPTNLEAHARRVDDHDEREYDAATSRATFDLREWLLTGLSLVRVGGVALGFEAVQRDDLPQPLERFPYEIAGKSRAIVAVRRSV
jgi:16S rRNA (guanine527-N7)-methyltransferase